MQSETIEFRDVTAELKVVDIKTSSAPPMYLSAEVQRECHAAIVKGRLARQRRFEIEALFNRLKETEQRVAFLERALREIRPHFLDDHPASKIINSALSHKK